MGVSGANPILTVQQNIPRHVDELEAEAAKILGRLLEIQKELTTCRMLLLITPDKEGAFAPPEPKEKP